MAGQGKGALRVAIEDFLETFDFPKIAFEWIKTIIEKFEDEAIDTYREFATNLGVLQYIPDMLKPDAMRKEYTKHPIQIIPILIAIVMMIIGLLIGVFAPLQRLGMYKIDRLVHSGRPSPLEAWLMAYRVNPDSPDVTGILQDLGFDDTIIAGYRALSIQLLQPLEYIAAFRRKEIDATKLVHVLKQQGYTLETMNTLLKITEIIPGVTDLVHFADRWAWDDTKAAHFRSDEEYPQDVSEWMEKSGSSAEWFKRYWRSHWQLPGMEQVFDMYHRLREGRNEVTFNDSDLDSFMQVTQYSPYWHKLLKAIAYQPITRVDIRRMYKLKLFDANEVEQRYLDIGYNKADAKMLADFTVKFEDDSGGDKREAYKALSFTVLRNLWEKGKLNDTQLREHLTAARYDEDEIKLIFEYFALDKLDTNTVDYRAQYVKEIIDYTSQAYIARMVTKQDATDALIAVGVTSDNIDFILNKADYAANLDQLNYTLKQIHSSYVAGALTRDMMIAELGKLGITGNTQSKIIDEMEADIKYRNRRLTEAEYRKAMLQNIITVDSYKENLRALGYIDYDIDILVALYVPSGG